MKPSPSVLFLVVTVLLAVADLVPSSPVRPGLIGDAHAIVGAPLTPMSYAGVARRTAYRETAAVTTAAAATTAAVATTAAAANAAAAQSAAAKTAAPPPPAPGTPLPVGTVVPQLPAGCVAAPISGVEYYLCGGNYYRASFQGNNLVYVVQRP